MTQWFTGLPQDVLQYEINPYLDPLSRIEWNKVLKPDERVYTKFPKDYAICHQLQVSLIIYQKILYNINECYNSQYTPDLPERMHFLLYRYAYFFLDCRNELVLKHLHKKKNDFLLSYNDCLNIEKHWGIYSILTDTQLQNFLDCLKIAIEKIKSISFLYQVNYEISI
jgi:hypothetical protein